MKGLTPMRFREGDYIVVINIVGSTELDDGTYGFIERVQANRYQIRIIGGAHHCEAYWIHPKDLVSADFYCSVMAEKAIRDALTDWHLDKLSKAKTKKAKAEIMQALQDIHNLREPITHDRTKEKGG